MYQILLQLRLAITPLFLIAFSISSASAAPINPNPFFSDGLNFWNGSGSVEVVDGAARLSDQGGAGGVVFQSLNLGLGDFTLSFDLKSGLSSEGTTEAGEVFPDVGFGTLYFANSDVSDFTGLDFIELFDVDFTGIVSALTAVDLGEGWQRYSFNFNSQYQYLFPMFELIDSDFTENSSLSIDNVILERRGNTEIPEPGTLSLLSLSALLGLSARKRRNS